MKKRKRIVLFVAVLLTLTVWDLSETSVAEATTGQVSVTGRIGETVTQEEEAQTMTIRKRSSQMLLKLDKGNYRKQVLQTQAV